MNRLKLETQSTRSSDHTEDMVSTGAYFMLPLKDYCEHWREWIISIEVVFIPFLYQFWVVATSLIKIN